MLIAPTASVAPLMLKKNKPFFSILFVCAVNTSRSPALKGVMEWLVKNKGLERQIYVESAGLQPFCLGAPPDKQMQKIARSHGVDIDNYSKLFKPTYFDQFDAIFCVTKEIVSAIRLMARTEEEAQKVFIATEFSEKNPMQDIPYPNYNKLHDREKVWKQILDACIGIYHYFLKEGAER